MKKNQTGNSINYNRTVESTEISQILKELDTYGFATISGFLTTETVSQIKALTESHYNLLNKEGKIQYNGVPDRNKDDKILYNLQNIDKAYIDILTTQPIIEIASAKLNDPHYGFLPIGTPNYILNYYNARSSGQKLDLHIDSLIHFYGNQTNMMQFVFLLEDSTTENGCTIVVPGSHKSSSYTDRDLQKTYPLTAKAGDLVMWDSRLWHGTIANTSGRSRWALVATLSMWWVKPSMDIVRGMNDTIYQKCSDQQKQFLGFCSVPPLNPLERNNTKCGYDFLKPSIKDYNF